MATGSISRKKSGRSPRATCRANPSNEAAGNPGGQHRFQRNFIIKNMVALMKNGIIRISAIPDAQPKGPRLRHQPFERMGLFENSPGNGTPIVHRAEDHRTASLSLFGTSFDAARPPRSASGKPRRRRVPSLNGKFVYVLWAKTATDQSESATATFSFPGNLAKI